MRFSFKKIGSVLASTAMLSSTIALAAAASFPAPFVTSSGADVAIVHGGANAAYTDLVAVTDISIYKISRTNRSSWRRWRNNNHCNRRRHTIVYQWY
jgi:hypothetical protein